MIDFENYPIIAAIRCEEDFDIALTGEAQAIFMLSSNLLTVAEHIEQAHKAGKLLYVHMDFIHGLSNDADGVKYLKTKGVDGIISTRTNVIATAAECGISSVQRFFMLDSRSVDTALETISHSKAEMVEIMPGIATKAIEEIKRKVHIPIIAGGLIDKKEEIFAALGAGASMVSTGKKELWNM